MGPNHSLAESFRHAFDGLVYAVKGERNMKIHCAATVIVIIFAFALGLSGIEKAILLTLCGLVLAAEMFNTAIENAVNIAAPTFNMYAKFAKDTAAGAVLVLSITAAVVGIIIFLPYGIDILGKIQQMI